MAAPKTVPTLQQQETTRAAIKTTQLVNRLQYFALAENDAGGQVVEIDPGRLRAIEILLRKTLPDLTAVNLSGDPNNPVHITWPEVINLVGRRDKPTID